jgi:hypothetical protein
MPLNEAEGYLPSTLTEKQQREAEKAIYGLAEREPIMSPESLSYEDRVRMRRILDQLDQKEATNASRTFDLNKPPAPPYVYREFPFLMYDHESKRTRPAHNHEERERMMAEGWSDSPFPSEQPEIPLTAAEHAEADDINQKLKKKKTS